MVLTLWEDDIREDGATVTIDMFGQAAPRRWQDKLGNKERIRNRPGTSKTADHLLK